MGPGSVSSTPSARPKDDLPVGASGAGSDSVQISPAARYLQMYHSLPAVRLAKVAAARAAIQSGELDAPDKLSVAIDRLLEDILGD